MMFFACSYTIAIFSEAFSSLSTSSLSGASFSPSTSFIAILWHPFTIFSLNSSSSRGRREDEVGGYPRAEEEQERGGGGKEEGGDISEGSNSNLASAEVRAERREEI